jgi:hypothetical protein
MSTFISMQTDLPIRQDRCSLFDVSWRDGGVVALFCISERTAPEPQAVRVTFKKIIVMRIVDEMVYSLEERGADIGITRDGFAYEVTDSQFLRTLTDASNLTYKNPRQYTFISLSDCLEVISNNSPQFDVVDIGPWLKPRKDT